MQSLKSPGVILKFSKDMHTLELLRKAKKNIEKEMEKIRIWWI